jgi:drug/metabolite transporter (DMT)-like permease
MKTAVVLTIAILANAVGNVLLSKGMRDYDSAAPSAIVWLVRAASHLLTDPWMIGGVLLLIVFLSAYMAALSWADLSFVLPATAPAYILTAVLARIYLHETVSLSRWGGTSLIVVGTCLVARSFVAPGERAPQQTQPAGSLVQ